MDPNLLDVPGKNEILITSAQYDAWEHKRFLVHFDWFV